MTTTIRISMSVKPLRIERLKDISSPIPSVDRAIRGDRMRPAVRARFRVPRVRDGSTSDPSNAGRGLSAATSLVPRRPSGTRDGGSIGSVPG